MISSTPFDLGKSRLVVAVALAGVTSAIWASIRLTVDNRQVIGLAAAVSVLAVNALAEKSIGAMMRTTVGRCVLAPTAGLALGAIAFGASSPHVYSLVWLGMLVTLIALASPASMRLLGSAGAFVAALTIIFGEYANSATPKAPVQVLAAACAALALAIGVSHTSCSRPVSPVGIALLIAAMSSAIASVNAQLIWTTSTLMFLVAAVVLLQLPHLRAKPYVQRPDQFVQTASQSALEWTAVMTGAAVFLLAGLDRTSIAWAAAGAIGAATIGLGASRFEVDRVNRTRIRTLERAAEESRIDSLTQMTNRRGLEERLIDEMARAKRFGHSLSALMIDIDDFKVLNDRFGHAEGDVALRHMASAIERSTRSIDLGGRFGGEEFLVLLPETDLDGALVVAERIRSAAETTNLFTVSIGVAEFDLRHGTGDELVADADAALYDAKRSGKNRIESAC